LARPGGFTTVFLRVFFNLQLLHSTKDLFAYTVIKEGIEICVRKHAGANVSEYFVLPKALTPYFFHRRKLQNYRTHAFLDMGACVHFVPRFDARDSFPEPETPQIFASRP